MPQRVSAQLDMITQALTVLLHAMKVHFAMSNSVNLAWCTCSALCEGCLRGGTVTARWACILGVLCVFACHLS